jgi:hypothetical protein
LALRTSSSRWRDEFGLVLVDLGEFRPRHVIDPQQFVELGMQRQRVAPARRFRA